MTRTGGEARRRVLLEEAVRQFGSKGYDGASLESVASACGVRKQTLLYYFPTKDALFEACVLEVSVRVAQALTDALAEELEPSRKAETVIRTLFSLAEEWPVFPQFASEALGPLRLRALGFLRSSMDEGRIRRQDPALLLFTLYTAVVGSITEAGVLRAVVGEDRGRMALRRREEEVLAFVRSALAPVAEEPPRSAPGAR